MSHDHRIEIYVDAPTYLALRARAEHEDRTISQHVRHLIRKDLEASMSEMLAARKRNSTGTEGEE